MRPVFEARQGEPGAVVYAEGEDERVLRAVQSWWTTTSPGRS